MSTYDLRPKQQLSNYCVFIKVCRAYPQWKRNPATRIRAVTVQRRDRPTGASVFTTSGFGPEAEVLAPTGPTTSTIRTARWTVAGLTCTPLLVALRFHAVFGVMLKEGQLLRPRVYPELKVRRSSPCRKITWQICEMAGITYKIGKSAGASVTVEKSRS